MVFYNRSKDDKAQGNLGLSKITDKTFLAKLKKEYTSNINIYKNDYSPLISGTVVNTSYGAN